MVNVNIQKHAAAELPTRRPLNTAKSLLSLSLFTFMKIAEDHQNRTANAEPHAVECDIANAVNFSNNGDSGYGDNSDNNNNDKTVAIITKILTTIH